MASSALSAWQTERADRLDELVIAYRLVGGPPRGRRSRTSALSEALILRLATEFQGFARDLHDLACDRFAAWTAPTNPAVEVVIVSRLREGRDLDRGNAHPGSLGRDFGRLGLELWPELAGRHRSSARHNQSLEYLNTARNAIAHDDTTTRARLQAAGVHLRLGTFQKWRRDLNALAGSLDIAVAEHLSRVFGRSRPW